MVLVCLTSVTAGRGDGPTILSLSIDRASPVLPTDARTLGATDAAVRGISTILAATFGLPMPPRVTVYVYAGNRAFEQGLITEAGVDPGRAAALSRIAIGIGERGQLLLNEGPSEDGRRWSHREWLRLIAHELTHVSQIEMADGEGRGEQWLAEGMAEWVAFATLERLRLDTMSGRRVMAIAGLRDHARLIQARLDLETRGTARGFTVWYMREGSLPTYQLAFLMADYLIERQGLDRVKSYFELFAHSRERHRNFRRAFGQSLAQFETEVLAHLNRVVGVPAASVAPDARATPGSAP